MQDVYKRIWEKEREIERIKTQFSLGKASLHFSKKRIKQLENEIKELVKNLPIEEREIYEIKKEFGKEF